MGLLGIALGLALLVDADIRGRNVYRTIIFLSYLLMTVAVAIIWRWMFDERVGLINYVARALHLIDKAEVFGHVSCGCGSVAGLAEVAIVLR